MDSYQDVLDALDQGLMPVIVPGLWINWRLDPSLVRWALSAEDVVRAALCVSLAQDTHRALAETRRTP